MHKILALAAVAGLTLGSGPAKADAIDDYAAHAMAAAHIPGLALAVVRDGRIEALRAYGVAELENGARATPQTRFDIASSTKILTGLLVMRLVDEGRLRLDDPVSRWLPDAPPAWAPITIAALAAHAAGLPETFDLPASASVQDVVRAAAAQPLAYPVGSENRYGLTTYAVLAAVLERAGGRPFEDLLQAEVLQPTCALAVYTHAVDTPYLGSISRQSDVVARRAWMYAWTDGEQHRVEFTFSRWNYNGAGLQASAEDFAHVAQALDRLGFLSAQAQAQLARPYRLTTGQDGVFSIGMQVRQYRGQTAIGFSGGPAHSDVLRFPRARLTIIVLTNQQNLLPILAEGIADIVHPLPAPAHPTVPDPNPALTQRLGAVVRGLSSGVEVPGLLPEMADYLPYLRASAAVVGSPDEWRFLSSAATAEGGRTVRYLAVSQGKPVIWTFGIAADDHITGLGAVTE